MKCSSSHYIKKIKKKLNESRGKKGDKIMGLQIIYFLLSFLVFVLKVQKHLFLG